MNVFNTRVQTADLSDQVAAQADRIAALESATPETPEMPDLSGIEGRIDTLSETLADLGTRLDELESRPAPVATGSDGPSEEYAAELAALQASVEAQKSEIAALIENAQTIEEATADAARTAAAQTALAKVTAALSSGAAYQSAMSELEESGIDDIPAALQAPASDGVATQQSLQADFPDAARAALSAARAAGEDGEEGGFGGFLRRQLGARSVAPREGSDPDAVLSRAEDAVRNGNLSAALTEIEGLPADAQTAMDDWVAAARARVEAEAAVQTLSQRLTAN